MLKSGTYTQLAPILFGNGCAGQAGEAVGNLGCKKVLLVSDEGVLAAGAVETVKKALLGAGIQVIVWAEAQTDCPEDTVKAAGLLEGMNPWTESSALEGEACWIQPKQYPR